MGPEPMRREVKPMLLESKSENIRLKKAGSSLLIFRIHFKTCFTFDTLSKYLHIADDKNFFSPFAIFSTYSYLLEEIQTAAPLLSFIYFSKLHTSRHLATPSLESLEK